MRCTWDTTTIFSLNDLLLFYTISILHYSQSFLDKKTQIKQFFFF